MPKTKRVESIGVIFQKLKHRVNSIPRWHQAWCGVRWNRGVYADTDVVHSFCNCDVRKALFAIATFIRRPK